MNIIRTAAGLAAGAALAASLAACGGTAHPSALCVTQFHEVGALQAEARAISGSSTTFTASSYAQFNADVDHAGRLLKAMKAENCPDGGY